MPRFTESKDGVERCTVLLRIRLTREEWQTVLEHARRRGDDSPHDVLELEADLAIDLLIHQIETGER